MSRVEEQYREACQYLAGGVSASTRVNRAVGHPLLFDRADGCRYLLVVCTTTTLPDAAARALLARVAAASWADLVE